MKSFQCHKGETSPINRFPRAYAQKDTLSALTFYKTVLYTRATCMLITTCLIISITLLRIYVYDACSHKISTYSTPRASST